MMTTVIAMFMYIKVVPRHRPRRALHVERVYIHLRRLSLQQVPPGLRSTFHSVENKMKGGIFTGQQPARRES